MNGFGLHIIFQEGRHQDRNIVSIFYQIIRKMKHADKSAVVKCYPWWHQNFTSFERIKSWWDCCLANWIIFKKPVILFLQIQNCCWHGRLSSVRLKIKVVWLCKSVCLPVSYNLSSFCWLMSFRRLPPPPPVGNPTKKYFYGYCVSFKECILS